MPTVMNAFFTLSLFLSLTLFAEADLVVEMQIEDPTSALTGPMTVTTKTKGEKSRSEASLRGLDAPIPTFTDRAKGEMITLDPLTKTFTRIRFEAGQKKPVDSAKIEVRKDVPTIREKVGKWDAEIYELTKDGEQQRVWIVKAFPNADAIKAELAGAKEDVDALDAGKFYLGEMVVKLEVHHKGSKYAFTLLKASVEPVADSEFLIPEGYKEAKR